MKKTTILILILALALLVLGCTRNYGPTGYATAQQQQPQNNPYQGYYGGGCGIAPSEDISESPVEGLAESATNL